MESITSETILDSKAQSIKFILIASSAKKLLVKKLAKSVKVVGFLCTMALVTKADVGAVLLRATMFFSFIPQKKCNL